MAGAGPADQRPAMMQSQMPHRDFPVAQAPSSLFPPVVSATLGACAAVGTAAWLGADWLREPVAGLPAGAWLIGAGAGWAWAASRRRSGAFVEGSVLPAVTEGAASDDVVCRLRPSPGTGTGVLSSGGGLAGSVGALLAAACDGASALGRRVPALGGFASAWGERLGEWHDRSSWPSSPLRIGVDASDDAWRALTHSDGTTPVRWAPVPRAWDDRTACRRLGLDAVVRHYPHGPVRITFAEHEDREAAWYDWSSPPPLTFASLFPVRVDPARVTLNWVDLTDRSEVALLRAVVEGGAALSRTAARLSLADRLRGRRPLTGGLARVVCGGTDGETVEGAMRHLGRCLAQSTRSGDQATPLQRAAANAASAWVSGADALMDPEERLRTVETAWRILGDEPEVLLRLVAARFAAFQDRGALEAVLGADRAIRERNPEPITDHMAFLQSEVELGLPAPQTLGRVAAGICLVCATSPVERIAYLRDDVTDDMRYSGWLVGRDQDRALLTEVFRVLERQRLAAQEAVRGSIAA